MKLKLAVLFSAMTITAFPSGIALAESEVRLTIDPTTRRTIRGIGELDRQTLFAMCDQGNMFDKRIDSPERMQYLLDDLNITFGRLLGPINAVVKWGGGVNEDLNRPGYADIAELEQRLTPDVPGDEFRRFTGGRLDVVAHGNHNAYPEFMGRFTTDMAQEGRKPQYLPQNIEAAAELAATVMAENYSDFDRPRYFEPVNEPHWSFYNEQHLADWHLATMDAVKARTPEVLVGGPCSSVAYYYKRDFQAFNGIKQFMANTQGELDFYSFHVYDYLRWQDGRVQGRVSTGPPTEGVLDLVQAHAYHTYGQEYDLIISEHGGYFNDPDSVNQIAEKFLPKGAGFDHEMKVRSIASHALVSSAIANTLTFMDHPHVVKKAVPFILLHSMNWDPRYYSTIYVARDFTDKADWVECTNLDFFKFFRDLSGERVVVEGGDPDLQVRAFVDGRDLRVVINNVSEKTETVSLDVPATSQMKIRRYALQSDYTPLLTESELDSVEGIEVSGREAVLITARYPEPIEVARTINEVPFYAESIQVKPEPGKPARFVVEIEDSSAVERAILRIGVTRPSDADPDLRVMLNGKRLDVPLEDAAPRYTNADEYAYTKMIEIDPDLLRDRNTVFVAFPDGGSGAFGTVVIRAGYVE